MPALLLIVNSEPRVREEVTASLLVILVLNKPPLGLVRLHTEHQALLPISSLLADDGQVPVQTGQVPLNRLCLLIPCSHGASDMGNENSPQKNKEVCRRASITKACQKNCQYFCSHTDSLREVVNQYLLPMKTFVLKTPGQERGGR